MLGVFQIAQEAPDLRNYFDAESVPAFSSAGELVAKVRAALAEGDERRRRAQAARQRALAEHTWTRRFPELIADLQLSPRTSHERSGFFSALVAALASRAETEGRIGAAEALWREAEERGNQDAPAALGRCLHDLGRHEEAIEFLRRGATAPTCAGSIHATLASHGVGVGLGRLGLLPPAAEPAMLLVASLVALERIDDAARVLDTLEGATARAVAASLTFGERAELAPLREALARLLQKSA
jgi:hypothetical protein